MKGNRSSATAYLIAVSTVFLSKSLSMGHLVPARSAELSKRFISMRSRFARWLSQALVAEALRPLVDALERWTIPGIQLHYALRKRYLEEVAREALTDGIRQVVAFGAGFDTLLLRLHEGFPTAQFIEIDHPATQEIKSRALARYSLSKDNLRLIGLDLARESREGALLSSICAPTGAQTLFIAEGLLMYLDPTEVDGLLRFACQHSAQASRLAFTFMESDPQGRIAFRGSSWAVGVWLRWKGEPFKWGISRERLVDYLAARGFIVREIMSAGTLSNRYLAPDHLAHLPLADGECICVAERV
jgi:methyltransferase (TIGR00027 family)